MHTLRRDLQELGPVTRVTVADDGGSARPIRRVYRVEAKDMVEFYTIRYGDDSRIDDLDLLREF